MDLNSSFQFDSMSENIQEEQDVYRVEYIFGKRLEADNQLYAVKWKDYPKSTHTWQQQQNNQIEREVEKGNLDQFNHMTLSRFERANDYRLYKSQVQPGIPEKEDKEVIPETLVHVLRDQAQLVKKDPKKLKGQREQSKQEIENRGGQLFVPHDKLPRSQRILSRITGEATIPESKVKQNAPKQKRLQQNLSEEENGNEVPEESDLANHNSNKEKQYSQEYSESHFQSKQLARLKQNIEDDSQMSNPKLQKQPTEQQTLPPNPPQDMEQPKVLLKLLQSLKETQQREDDQTSQNNSLENEQVDVTEKKKDQLFRSHQRRQKIQISPEPRRLTRAQKTRTLLKDEKSRSRSKSRQQKNSANGNSESEPVDETSKQKQKETNKTNRRGRPSQKPRPARKYNFQGGGQAQTQVQNYTFIHYRPEKEPEIPQNQVDDEIQIEGTLLSQIKSLTNAKEDYVVKMNKLEGDKLSAYGWFAKDSPKRIKWHLFGVSEDQPKPSVYFLIDWRRRSTGFKPSQTFVTLLDLIIHSPKLYYKFYLKYNITLPREKHWQQKNDA